ncbi:hypothetical protein Q9L58_008892 [Maublancomyces gigas]|uniref:Sulfhydryl oxidase n=1 Tax=Discina gigas TaxID=1032678 RepID=A0ABR3G8E6_9PEZI
MTRSKTTAIAAVLAVVLFFSYILLPSSHTGPRSTYSPPASITSKDAVPTPHAPTDPNGFAIAPDLNISKDLLHGATIMPKLGNETIKAELGRASWKLLHTTLARFPTKPTPDEREALSSYLHLFARLYPCGECASHFQQLLRQYKPQTSSRDAASQWGCHIHNLVNERLHKPEFDCGSVTETYKCGCADAEDEGETETTEGITQGRRLTVAEGVDLLEENTRGARVEVQKEG